MWCPPLGFFLLLFPVSLVSLFPFISTPHVVYFTAHWFQHRFSRGRQICAHKNALSSLFSICLFFWREGQGDILIHLVALVLTMYQSPSFQLQCICCIGGWCKACTSLFRISFFSPSYLLFFKSFSTIPIQIDALLWAERIPINLEVVCLVLLIRSILCRRETGKIVTQLKRNLSELQ